MAAARPLSRPSEIEPLAAPACEARARELFERHERRITSFCRWRLGSVEDAEDAAQTTFLHALGALRRGVVPVAEVPWLLTIARNVCHDRLAAARRRAGVEVAQDPQALAVSAAGRPAAGDELLGLEEALRVLPEQQRRALLLREWQGLSYREIAEDMGLSLPATEALIFRARRGLAGRLSEGATPLRARLAGLLDAGALLGGLKSLAGGAAAVKLAAAGVVAAAGVAIVAAGVPGGLGSSAPAERPKAQDAAVGSPLAGRDAPDGADVTRRIETRAPKPPARTKTTRAARDRRASAPAAGGASPDAAPGAGEGTLAEGPASGPPAGLADVTPPPVASPNLSVPQLTTSPAPLPQVTAPVPAPVQLPEATVPVPSAPALPAPELPAAELPAVTVELP